MNFHNKELLGAEETGKRIIYDIYCTMKVPPGKSAFKSAHLHRDKKDKDVPHHFILEMQNVYEAPFEDRMLYYASRLISSQGETGWKYDLDPVISMTVTDFDFSFLTPRVVQDFRVTEQSTGEVLTSKFRMLFFSLKQVPDEWDKCKDEVERLLYLIKNMENLDKNARPYIEGGYEDMFDAAESSGIAAEDVVPYSRSLTRLREIQFNLDLRYDEGVEYGRVNVARNMLRMNMDDDTIAYVTKLSPERIQELRTSNE